MLAEEEIERNTLRFLIDDSGRLILKLHPIFLTRNYSDLFCIASKILQRKLAKERYSSVASVSVR